MRKDSPTALNASETTRIASADAYIAHCRGVTRGKIDAIDHDRAIQTGEIGRQQPQDRKPGDGIAATAFANDSDAFAPRDVNVDSARRLPYALGSPESNAKSAHRHQSVCAAWHRSCRLLLCRTGYLHQPAACFFSFTSCSSISISVPITPSLASRSISASDSPRMPASTSRLCSPRVGGGERIANGLVADACR